MGKVVQMLEGIMTIERPPAPKALDGTLSITSGSVSVSANSTFAASAAVPSSSSSLQALGGSSSVSGRNNEKVSSSLYGSNQF
ncbi:hypothetical protein QJS10_CPB13g01182 [Acorus calamus]|uniref:Uncharacterized protein n=1 Tax=Acorus calamus TaxID=4465 RepID=A0AAV9DI52_ACOCL|nr:hypothetical protein QJS10_CPB13g01182 [Acorus calamus]